MCRNPFVCQVDSVNFQRAQVAGRHAVSQSLRMSGRFSPQ